MPLEKDQATRRKSKFVIEVVKVVVVIAFAYFVWRVV